MTSWLELPDAHIRFRIKRIPTGKFVIGKRYLTNHEVEQLFDGEVVITEKIDGKQVTKDFSSIINGPVVIGGEKVKDVHSIFYNKIPRTSGWFILWEVYDMANKMSWSYNEQIEVATYYGLDMVPLLFRGETTLDKALLLLDRKSSFGDETQEGIVIKNYHKGLSGKIVREEFVAGIELKGHWLRAKGEAKMNGLS